MKVLTDAGVTRAPILSAEEMEMLEGTKNGD